MSAELEEGYQVTEQGEHLDYEDGTGSEAEAEAGQDVSMEESSEPVLKVRLLGIWKLGPVQLQVLRADNGKLAAQNELYLNRYHNLVRVRDTLELRVAELASKLEAQDAAMRAQQEELLAAQQCTQETLTRLSGCQGELAAIVLQKQDLEGKLAAHPVDYKCEARSRDAMCVITTPLATSLESFHKQVRDAIAPGDAARSIVVQVPTDSSCQLARAWLHLTGLDTTNFKKF
eukprot:gene13797-13918_t